MTIELLAPAGDAESFFSAVNAGADAVYVGMKDFSARSKAANFSYKELFNMCSFAKEKKVKVYAALNTLLRQKDVKKAFSCLSEINEARADAVIVQDAGLAEIAGKYFPDLKLHASTQLAVHNSFGVKQAQKNGFSRIVLARELSYEQIKTIRSKTDCELEVFCHGALCFCVSGLCLFSSFIGGYSGNRGFCTQPCRRLWESGAHKGYFLSPKDLQLAGEILKLKESGINCLKIEGRMKKADYVYKTVKAYRMILDAPAGRTEEAVSEALNILGLDYARSKTAFNFIKRDEDIFEPQKSKNTGLYAGTVSDVQNGNFTVETDCTLDYGDTIRIVDKKRDRNEVIKVEKIEKNGRLHKIFHEGVYMENGFEIFKTADRVKKTEDGSKEILLQKEPPALKQREIYKPVFKRKINLPRLFLRIDDFKWTDFLKDAEESLIFKINAGNFNDIENIKWRGNYFAELPAFIEEEELDGYSVLLKNLIKAGCRHFFLNNISQFEFFKKENICLYAGQFLYNLNAYSAEFFEKSAVRAFAVSWEDDCSNVCENAGLLNGRMILYLSGFPELAVSKMFFKKEAKNSVVKSGKDEFKTVSYGSLNAVIPKYPVMLFGLKSFFLKCKINSFAIDLSHVKPDKNYLKLNLDAFYKETPASSLHKFNFARNLK